MFALLRHRLTKRTLGTLFAELILVHVCLWACFYFAGFVWTVDGGPGDSGLGNSGLGAGLLFSLSAMAVSQFSFWSCGLYSRRVVYSGWRVFRNLFVALAITGVLLVPVCYVFLSFSSAAGLRSTLAYAAAVLSSFAFLTTLERFAVLKVFDGTAYLGNILIVGTSECTRVMLEEVRLHHGASLRFVGILSDSRDEIGGTIEGVRIVGTIAQIAKCRADWSARTLVLSVPFDHPDLSLDFLLECKLAGYNILDAATFYESIGQKILLEKLDPVAVLFPGGYSATRVRWVAKDVIEKFFVLFLVLVLALPLLVTYLLVRLTSPGPVIYRQQRVGKGGKVFTLFKFRTMVHEAEKHTGAVWAAQKDPRVTRIGRILRRTRFDEIPQLLNVLRGDMAFVGPRPERPEFVEALRKAIPFYHYRHYVKPGLTGWAQVAFPYAGTMDESREKLRYDLYYVKNMSLFFDSMIVLATMRAVITGIGSR